MSIETVAILSPGDMGHAVGQLLREHELRVVTCLAGRSQRTRDLSESAGITDVANLNDMVAQSQIILSISVSEMVPSICQKVAAAINTTQRGPVSGGRRRCEALGVSYEFSSITRATTGSGEGNGIHSTVRESCRRGRQSKQST